MGFFRVRRLIDNGSYAEAIPLLNDLLAKQLSSKKLAEASYMLGTAHVMLAEFDLGIKELQSRCIPALEKKGLVYGKALYALGYALSAVGDWKSGLEVLTECRNVMRDAGIALEEARVVNHMAQCCLSGKDVAKAESWMKEAKTLLDKQKIDPKSITASLLVRNAVVQSKVLYARGAYAEARTVALDAKTALEKIVLGDSLLEREIAALLDRPDRNLIRIPTVLATAGAAVICGLALLSVM